MENSKKVLKKATIEELRSKFYTEININVFEDCSSNRSFHEDDKFAIFVNYIIKDAYQSGYNEVTVSCQQLLNSIPTSRIVKFVFSDEELSMYEAHTFFRDNIGESIFNLEYNSFYLTNKSDLLSDGK